MYVGFKRMKIQPFAADGTPDGDLIIIEGKTNKGATSTAEISGLSKEATKVAGSDIAYYISRKGVGDVKSDFGILDLPLDAQYRILGYHTDETNKLTYIGSDTEAPYCGVVLESSDAQSNKAVFAFFKGTFSMDKVSLKTLDPNETFKPEAESYSFSAIATDAAGPQNGQYVVQYFGKDGDEAFTTLENQVLLTPAPKA
ncbi:major tail protein [Lacticaseibacillus rhamnosus]|uniref:major tail protein n=1 Tax=Lacticaseibacillus rhamnosus TaxID=47715 RepID=UPI00237F9BA6|nr:major tail protein [Lacticaseibacillus rhamnosus]MDE3295910.1 phage tail protein [Lacticaseibacillus rhamnosus]